MLNFFASAAIRVKELLFDKALTQALEILHDIEVESKNQKNGLKEKCKRCR
ncbi:hypothetical protein [Salinimicrobium oceani]|uniref:Uncharacterized protein n=1 Tax=Salinimicrobium oceani TaxID=2722702 RepID=A0ABX1CYN6_9FLAO|nr:hypothetical protein [Salinimicrobium oceani]NJW53055.1 hypothetical protein [Salinimicrobium oceani]